MIKYIHYDEKKTPVYSDSVHFTFKYNTRHFNFRWPSLIKVDADCLNNDTNIKEMIKECMKYENELLCYLSTLPIVYDRRDEKFEYIRRLGLLSKFDENACLLRFYCFHDKLIKLIEADPL